MSEFTWLLPSPSSPLLPGEEENGVVNHPEVAVRRLPQQFKGKPKIDSLVRKLLSPLADLEQTLLDLRTVRTIETAEGEQLAILAKIVGQKNLDFSADDLRTMIRARVRANRSNGRGDDVLEVARLIVGEDPTIGLSNEGHAGFTLRFDDEIVTFDQVELLMTQFMREVVSGAGVKVVVEHHVTDPADSFRFNDAANGLGDTGNPSTGGLLASAME